jgi:tetratricopeptide (TPR) repeat protein
MRRSRWQKSNRLPNAAPRVAQKHLTAQEWFEQGYRSDSSDEKIRCYTEAIRLKPDYADAYINRGNARIAQGDLDGAIGNYQKHLDLGGGVRDGDQSKVEDTIRNLKKKQTARR